MARHRRDFSLIRAAETIIRDQNLLKNIQPLNVPARVPWLTGIKNITHQADL